MDSEELEAALNDFHIQRRAIVSRILSEIKDSSAPTSDIVVGGIHRISEILSFDDLRGMVSDDVFLQLSISMVRNKDFVGSAACLWIWDSAAIRCRHSAGEPRFQVVDGDDRIPFQLET